MSPCKFFLQGRCARGDTCSFEHTEPRRLDLGVARSAQPPSDSLAIRPSSTSAPSRPQHPRDQPPSCRFFEKAMCSKGAFCPFLRAEPAASATTSTSTHTQEETDVRGRIPCKFDLRGDCRYGVGCSYKHADKQSPEATSQAVGDEVGSLHDRPFRLLMTLSEHAGRPR